MESTKASHLWLEQEYPREDNQTKERRREPRIPVESEALFTPLNHLTGPRQKATVIDVSKHGLKIAVSAALEPGLLIQVHLQGLIILAETRYCVAEKTGGFAAGVRIRNVFPKVAAESDCL